MTRSKSPARELAAQFNAAADPLYVLDESRTIIFCNRALAAWANLAEGELIGRRVDYTAGEPEGGPPGMAAGLCPPPEAFAGRAMSGYVSCMSPAGHLLHRRARFVPLGPTAENSAGVVAFVEGTDLHADELALPADVDPSAERLQVEVRRMVAAQRQRYGVAAIAGDTPAIRRARAAAAVAASSGASVVLVGPPGSGRQHLAHAIHYTGDPQKTGRLLPLEGELLGSDQLRSAIAARLREGEPGRRDTLLLVEIDQWPGESRAALAAALADPGVDFRLLATSRDDFVALSRAGDFPAELAALLGTLVIEMPSLDDRRSDLPLLAQLFLAECNAAGGNQVGSVSPEALDLLAAHAWPENLDELREVIAAAHHLAEGPRIEADDLPARVGHAAQAARYPHRAEQSIDLEQFLARIETELIARALERVRGNKTQAARLLGMTRPRFYRRLDQLGLGEAGEEAAG